MEREHVSDHQIQQLGPSVATVSPGPSARLGGGRVQEQLVVLESVDQTGNVAHKGLSLFGCHGFGEASTLRDRQR